MNRSYSAIKLYQIVLMCAIALFTMSAVGEAEVLPKDSKPTTAKVGKVVFKPIVISPSPDGEDYEGRFIFINKGDTKLMVSGFGKPFDGRFAPRFVRFQRSDGTKWFDVTPGYCGTGAQEFPMKPGISYEFLIQLHDLAPWGIKKEDAPFTAKIGVGEFWSDPFVIDWRKDWEAGKFTLARDQHYKKVRAAFAKAGFKTDLLVGDDFPKRLLQSLMKQTTAGEATASFQPFVGEMDVVPSIEWDGTIRIDFESDDLQENRSQYRGWFSLNPSSFSPRWFRKAAERHVSAGKWGDGVEMELDDGTGFEGPLYFCINYVPHDKSKAPSVKDSEALFKTMLNVLAGWLKT